jgi:iron(III) transport system ATP-binding protein
MSLLTLSNVAKSFGDRLVLSGITASVAPGELIAILGASGGGKTTLLRLIAGFERPDAGEISLAGQLIAGGSLCQSPERRRIGYVAQEGALFPHLSVADNITFGLPRAARRARARVAELLALVGLPAAYAGRAPQSLSGGEQQRVALARALAPAPQLILLDEPFSALDAGLREETRRAVAAALRAAGATAILVTHDQAEAFSLGHRVGVLQAGALSALVTPETLYRAPPSAALASFIGEAMFTPATLRADRAECRLGALPVAAGLPDGPATLMVRPEQLKLGPAGQGVAAIVETVTFYGHDAMVRLRRAGAAPDEAPFVARVFSHNAPATGTEVGLAVEGPIIAFPAAATP